jgi:hypothetical protein
MADPAGVTTAPPAAPPDPDPPDGGRGSGSLRSPPPPLPVPPDISPGTPAGAAPAADASLLAVQGMEFKLNEMVRLSCEGEINCGFCGLVAGAGEKEQSSPSPNSSSSTPPWLRWSRGLNSLLDDPQGVKNAY